MWWIPRESPTTRSYKIHMMRWIPRGSQATRSYKIHIMWWIPRDSQATRSYKIRRMWWISRGSQTNRRTTVIRNILALCDIYPQNLFLYISLFGIIWQRQYSIFRITFIIYSITSENWTHRAIRLEFAVWSIYHELVIYRKDRSWSRHVIPSSEILETMYLLSVWCAK